MIENGSFVSTALLSQTSFGLLFFIIPTSCQIDRYNKTNNNDVDSSLKYLRVCFVPGSSFMHALFVFMTAVFRIRCL